MRSSKKIWETFFVGNSALWTAIFTGVLVLFTAMLAWVAYKSNENSVTTQRAFVNFNNIIPTKVMTADGKRVGGINFFVNWTNSGTTPTKKATSQANVQAWRSELPKGFDFADLADLEKRSTVIGPKATIFQAVGVTIDNIKDVLEGKSHLYFWGWMVYQDIFSDTPHRLTEFCVAEFAYNLVPCSKHNCYDEDCPDYKSRIK